MKFRSRLAVPLLMLAAAALVAWAPSSPTPEARADATPSLDEARTALLDLIGNEMQTLDRAKRIQRVAEMNSPEAMGVLLEALGIFASKWEGRQEDADATYKSYIDRGYDQFTSNGDPSFFENKKKLVERIERQDEVLRADGAVGRVFVASISKLTTKEAVDYLEKKLPMVGSVRARRVLFEGLLRNPESDAVSLAKKVQSEPDPGVRLVSFEAMGVRKLPELVPYLVKALQEKGWPHRQTAVRALGEIGDVSAVAPLISAMGTEDSRLVEDYADALSAIVGEKIGPFADAWKAWYDDHKQELADRGAKVTNVKKAKSGPRAAVDYYGIKTRSRRLVFIIDVSGSMKDPIGDETKGPVTGGKDGEDIYTGPKIEIAKKMLKQAIRALEEDTLFNIVVFNHSVRRFQPTMLKADQDGKNQAYLMINDLQPVGSTYTLGALKEAFTMAGRGVSDKAYDPGVDTIFLLSDGAPTDGDIDKAKPMDGDIILDAVAEWNALSRVQIHTIAIDPTIASGGFIKFMKSLAARNNGTYTEIPPKASRHK